MKSSPVDRTSRRSIARRLAWLTAPALPLALLAGAALGADAKPAAPKAAAPALSVAQILEKHVAARGGSSAWRAVQTISWSGKMELGSGDSAVRSARFAKSGEASSSHKDLVQESGAEAKPETSRQIEAPFTLTMQRPNKTRFELIVAGTPALQVYDGSQGWKVRPFLNRNDAEPFSAEELKSEQSRPPLEGPLLDAAAHGTRVELAGVEAIQGRSAYALKLTSKDGSVERVWIDAQSFLDIRVEGMPRRMDGRMHAVYVYQRDFRPVQGLTIPFVLETAVEGFADTHKILIEKVSVNPQLADNTFAKPAPGAAVARPAGAKPAAVKTAADRQAPAAPGGAARGAPGACSRRVYQAERVARHGGARCRRGERRSGENRCALKPDPRIARRGAAHRRADRGAQRRGARRPRGLAQRTNHDLGGAARER